MLNFLGATKVMCSRLITTYLFITILDLGISRICHIMEIREISNMPNRILVHSMHDFDFKDMEPIASTFRDIRDHLLLRTLLLLF